MVEEPAEIDSSIILAASQASSSRIGASTLVACHEAALSARAVPTTQPNKRTGELSHPNPQINARARRYIPNRRLGACQPEIRVAGMIVD